MVSAALLSKKEAYQKFKIELKLLHQRQRYSSPPGYDAYFIQPHHNSEPMDKKRFSDKERMKQLEQRPQVEIKDAEQQAKYEKLMKL